MKKGLFKKLLPHLIAIVLFLIISVLYCKPALDGQVLQQTDITSWKGSIQQSIKFDETHGKYPLWTNALFSGMPTFQIGYSNNNFIPDIIHKVMTLGLPAPIQYFFLASICFYILCIVLRINPYVGILGALGFAYATYNPVIIGVGHVTKMLTIAYMPALLASLLLIYERKYWLGAALTAIFTCVLISMNHPQVAYYFFITVAIMTIFFVIRWIRQKEWAHFIKAFGFTAIGAIVGFMTNAVTVMSTFEYQKETIRGGHTALTDTTVKKDDQPKDGLSKDYVFEYSVGVGEAFTMMMPRMYGGSSDSKDLDQEKSETIKKLQAMGQQQIEDFKRATGIDLTREINTYWGGLGGVGTAGPPFCGMVICILAILSFFVLDNKHKWWALTAIAFTVMMAWGGHFKAFNYFLYDHFPLYNKFRAPSIALVIPQLLLPMLAALGVNAYISAPDKKALWPAFKKGMIAVAAVFVVILAIYFTADYMPGRDAELLKYVKASGQMQFITILQSFFDGLVADRKSLFGADLLRFLLYFLFTAGTLFLLVRNIIKPLIAVALLTVFVFVDLISVDVKYLSKSDYEDKEDNEAVFTATNFDNQILADTSYYRVANLSGGAFTENFTSYHFNSIGGYHPAKLSLYNDIAMHKLPGEQQAVITALQTRPDSIAHVRTPILNMLNAKYFIFKQGVQTVGAWPNANAYGPVWFVQSIRYVNNADAEMAALDSIDPRTTAVVQDTFKSSIPFEPQADSAATIRLVKNDNDVVTYTSESAANQFAVFSEVYYKAGWKAFIDGKEAPIVKANYVLRALAIPAGKHSIEFKFEPKGYYNGRKLTGIFNIVLFVLVLMAAFMEWRASKKQVA